MYLKQQDPGQVLGFAWILFFLSEAKIHCMSSVSGTDGLKD